MNMENPGLKRHSVVPGSPATVYNPSGQPHTLQEDGPGSDPVDTYDALRRDDVMDMPPPTGVLTPDPVSAANGDAGMGPLALKQGAVLDTMRPAVQAPVNTANTPVRLNQQPNGLPQGQVPTPAAQQALNEQQHAQQLARQNEITRQKQPGGGETTQTYRDAQQKIQTQMEQRRVQAASADDFYNELYGAPAGSNEDEWHRFSVLPHPDQPEDTNDIGISVRQLPDEPEPSGWNSPGEDNPRILRQRFDYAVHHNGEPIISPMPIWGRRTSVNGTPVEGSFSQPNTHEEIARGVAHALGADGNGIQFLGTNAHALSTPDGVYHGWMGTTEYDDQGIPHIKDHIYTPSQLDFLRTYRKRLIHAGREHPYDFDEPESTLVRQEDQSPTYGERPFNHRQVKPWKWSAHVDRHAGGLASAQQAVRD